MAALRSDREEHRQWEAEQEAQRRKEREERIRREFERRLNPRSKEDFEVLYHALESECWWSSVGYRVILLHGTVDLVMWVGE